jgi:hypothetical protein
MGMPYAIADAPGQPGIGTHQMGGAAYGGHACPGPVRASQRSTIIDLARGGGKEWFDMPIPADDLQKIEDASFRGTQRALDAGVKGPYGNRNSFWWTIANGPLIKRIALAKAKADAKKAGKK